MTPDAMVPCDDKSSATMALAIGSLPSMMKGAGLILDLRPTNERRCYFVTTSLTGWAQTSNQLWGGCQPQAHSVNWQCRKTAKNCICSRKILTIINGRKHYSCNTLIIYFGICANHNITFSLIILLILCRCDGFVYMCQCAQLYMHMITKNVVSLSQLNGAAWELGKISKRISIYLAGNISGMVSHSMSNR